MDEYRVGEGTALDAIGQVHLRRLQGQLTPNVGLHARRRSNAVLHLCKRARACAPKDAQKTNARVASKVLLCRTRGTRSQRRRVSSVRIFRDSARVRACVENCRRFGSLGSDECVRGSANETGRQNREHATPRSSLVVCGSLNVHAYGRLRLAN